MLIGPPIPEIQLFQDLTMKIQGQAHGWGQSSKSQYESSIPSTHISLVPCQSALLFMRYSIFKVWAWKSKDKVTAQGHKVGITLSTHIPFVPCLSDLLFLGYSYFKIWRWKFKVKVWGQIWKLQHRSNIRSTHIPSFHVNWASHSWVTTFSKFDL